jgi:hypothetical protein
VYPEAGRQREAVPAPTRKCGGSRVAAAGRIREPHVGDRRTWWAVVFYFLEEVQCVISDIR